MTTTRWESNDAFIATCAALDTWRKHRAEEGLGNTFVSLTDINTIQDLLIAEGFAIQKIKPAEPLAPAGVVVWDEAKKVYRIGTPNGTFVFKPFLEPQLTPPKNEQPSAEKPKPQAGEYWVDGHGACGNPNCSICGTNGLKHKATEILKSNQS